MNSTKKILISELVFDYTLYPRHKISDYNVSSLCKVIESGVDMDPILWDKTTKCIVDGFHRVTAFKKVFGVNYEVEGIERDFRDKGEMILESIRLNNKHGLKLSAWDQARCIILAKSYKIKDEVIKMALAIPEHRYKELNRRTVPIKNNEGKKVGNCQLKYGQDKIADKPDGRYVTEEEAEGIDGGMTGNKAIRRIRTLIKDFEMNNFEVTKANIDEVSDLIRLMANAVKEFENA